MKRLLQTRRIIELVAIPALGFLLLNLTFLLASLFNWLVDTPLPATLNSTQWFSMLKHSLFTALVLVLSWSVLTSRLVELYKASYSTVPVALGFITVGLLFHQWPLLIYIIGVLLYSLLLYFFYRTRLSWEYFYSTTLVALVFLVMQLIGAPT